MLHTVAIISLALGLLSFFIMLIDILSGNKQKMMIMNFVYPLTGLYAGPLALIVYYTIGRKSTAKRAREMEAKGEKMNKKPFWQSVAVGALHCGSGCTLGDIIAETLLLYITVVVLGSKLLGGWVIDYAFAFAIGIIFQYFSIKPMKNLSPKDGFIAALKADTLSLTSWQIGMYGGMAIAFFLIFHQKLEANSVLFWFVMQIAMLLGFCTAYPMNWFLIKKGIKEEM